MGVPTIQNYINGEWVSPNKTDMLDVVNPATGVVLAQTLISSDKDVEAAVSAAQQAYPNWAATPVSRRCEPLFKLAHLVRTQEEEVARVLSAEMGKSLPDARAEMKRTIENIENACGMPSMQQGDKLIGAAAGIDGEIIRLPMGVFAMIAPFNFPAMVPFWFLPYAIATGNTFVLKPSERVPMTMELLARYIDASGLPPGVFNMTNGDKTAASALVDNPAVQGVSFVGTSSVARNIAERCARSNKRFQAMGSAKNHLVVMPDAPVDQVIQNMLTSCFGCAGQRCMAASVIVCVGDTTYSAVSEQYVEASKNVIVADPLDPAVADETLVMGPVISLDAKQFIHKMIETGVQEGATLALDGRNIVVPGCENGFFVGPSVFTDVTPGMAIHQTEIFGPVVCIMKANNLDEAIAMINAHPFGNGASIYTNDGHWARKFKLETQAGMIGINVGIPAPVAYLPFGGMKASQFADIKTQGKAIVNFYTQDKVITERYWPREDGE
jgi:malonate-semialdehyde dehydrogenase (acetylating) / methylmalonate-semialdehyde dehydrogenase